MTTNAAVSRINEAAQFHTDRKAWLRLRVLYSWLLRLKRTALSERTVIDYYYENDVDDRAILLTGIGRDISGNLKYILEVLNSDERFSDFHIYVRTTADETDETVRAYIKKMGWTRTSTIPKGYDRMLESCKFLLTESYFPYQFIKKPGQVMTDIWHGTPLKCLGVLKSGNQIHNTAIQQKNFLSADYLMYPNDFTRDTMWRSYNITDLLSAKSLMMGYPRTAGMLRVTEEEKSALRKSLVPDSVHKIYAYMPTLRRYLKDDEFMPRVRSFLAYLDSALNDEEILYVNMHHYHHLNDQLDVSVYRHIRKFPEEVDNYRLLTITDALITDYSSVFFDYLILKKQVILYVEDIEEYMKYQGLNLDLRDLPLDIAYTADDVSGFLRKGRQHEDSEMISDLYRYDAADNPEKLCALFLRDEEGLEISDIPGSDLKKAMFYTDGFISPDESGILCDLAAMHESEEDGAEKRYRLYIGCDEKLWRKHAVNAYNDSGRVPVITSRVMHPLSSVGKPVLKLYLDGKISFSKAIKLLAYEYRLTDKRMYGCAQFDLMCIYDTADPETVIGLALSDAPVKVLFLSSEMIKRIRSGSTFLRDAVGFASGYCDLILVREEKDLEFASSVMPQKAKCRLKAVNSAESLEKAIDRLINSRVN
ncbi:MAG: CDP-glycerol glycerophosphotransferase family protein [Eubacterium sp.]|nr:CDP-glycerol glycerophosphotransferase family protein [Eubacterium sp.]